MTTSERARNARGVIAEHYHDLQSLGLVERARFDRDVGQASAASLLRTVAQACEIGLYNMADLLRRAARDAGDGTLAACLTKLSWLRGFQHVLVRASSVSATYTAARPELLGDGAAQRWLAESPAFREYLRAVRGFDAAVQGAVEAGVIDVERALSEESIGNTTFSILHLVRVCNHDSTVWERNLLRTVLPLEGVRVRDFLASRTVRAAVYEHRLRGDTYFTQFRALHQIPELVGAEMNDRLEEAIRAARRGDRGAVAEQLLWVNALAAAVTACLRPMIDNLATSDYHEIRENLGLTSGSHSVGLRYHLFTDLYEQLCEAIGAWGAPDEFGGLVASQVAAFRAFVFEWRDEHLHLPRNNLGSDGTRSLTGSPDAVAVVRRMAAHACAHDPAAAVLAGGAPVEADGRGPLRHYLASKESLDSLVLTATGRVTQSKFVEVQERLGFFANRCPFTKPPRRVV
jgi:hypothetical protein